MPTIIKEETTHYVNYNLTRNNALRQLELKKKQRTTPTINKEETTHYANHK